MRYPRIPGLVHALEVGGDVLEPDLRSEQSGAVTADRSEQRVDALENLGRLGLDIATSLGGTTPAK